ncbi:hypothetical protein [Bacillus cereus]|uniref:hypothetical protein n=1 Tax=Bacillus cereus TaxID=1396 RepID=UPI000A382B1E|nr:hypothetical protein [Bacillus cereus]OTW95534.1 hypothetical protein BK711_21075 [Bacillus thuringiensis serovar fukuokaensis]MBJ8024670.1 hypothetical protein [Bacillus cereus]MBJ8037064.1 hypothetical protein [Bacillus cereus]PFN28872.1 hypothetical protein COJ60_30120 [Bacillus cereus]RAT04921.1 hypothetical protein A6E22_16285 [Bacillus cereus]
MKNKLNLLHYIGLLIAFLPVLLSIFILKEQLKWKFAIPLILIGGIIMFIAKLKKDRLQK